MEDKRIRPGVWLAVFAILSVVVIALVLMPGSRPDDAGPAETPAADDPVAETATAGRERASRSHTSSRAASPQAAPVLEQPEYIEGLVWGEIDLREAKALMPDNLYWKNGAPTKDPEVLAARDEERRRRNEEYGRVLAGDANEDEVRAYYDYKKKLSADYLEFSEFMSRRYRNSENKEFIGMLELAMKMHAQKLKDLEGELEASIQKSRDAARAREEWQRQKEELGANGGLPPPDDELE
jgi:hypothetical protein